MQNEQTPAAGREKRMDYGKPGDPSGCYFPKEWRLLTRAREYVADALDAHEHSDGRDLINEIDATLEQVPSPASSSSVVQGDAGGVERSQWLWRIPGYGWVLAEREDDVVREVRQNGAWVKTEIVDLAALRPRPSGETRDCPHGLHSVGSCSDCSVNRSMDDQPHAPVSRPGDGVEGENIETSAWRWLSRLYPNDAPSDLAYDANEMVDAFVAGAGEASRMAKALWRISEERQYRAGYCQTDFVVEPALTAEEAQAVAREALSPIGPALTPPAEPVSRTAGEGEREAVARAIQKAIGEAWIGQHQAEVAAEAVLSLLSPAAPDAGQIIPDCDGCDAGHRCMGVGNVCNLQPGGER